MGYLDQDGLAYLWQKIKTALAGKQDAITPGDGLSKDGDTLNVDNPVRGIMTQTEFDALPEAQRSSGTYFVDDGQGGGGGGSGEVYSTEEQRIGTWIDGKPLYQKTILGTTNASHGDTTPTLALDSDIQVQVYECRMTYSGLNGFMMNAALGVNDWWLNTCVYPVNAPLGHAPGLYIQWSSSVNEYANPLTYLFTMKYTKATDQGVSA